MFLRRRPSARDLEAFASRAKDMPLSYGPVGMTTRVPAGFFMDRMSIVVGRGKAAFSKARAALLEWKHFDLGWIEVFPPRPPVSMGTDVVVLVAHLGFWSVNGCRIVSVVPDSGGLDQFGFAYGTLADHAEAGEELFKVSLDSHTEEVVYDILAVSRPRAPLAWLGFPVTRTLQARFRRDSAAAMRRAVA